MTDNRVVDLDKAVKAFGGYASLARKLKIATSTCHGWHARGNGIPPWRMDQIKQLAKRHGLDVWGPAKVRGARRKKSK